MSDPALAATAMIGLYPLGAVLQGRYEIVAPLGEGGMGAVYRVRDRELDEDVALKVLKPELAASPDALARFRREVKLARRVTHTNVARTYDLGVHDGARFLTMELIAGESVAAAALRKIPLAEALRIVLEACLGLGAAHAAGVVHRDLKPDNVMLADGRVVLTDFGIARAFEGADLNATLGNIIGTPAYMAPEQVEGKPTDGRTDVFALGVMLFELVTGQLPFHGDTAFSMAAARLAGPAPDPRTLSPDLPEGVAELITRALARRREDRPDASTVAHDLDRLRGARAHTAARSFSLSLELPRPAAARTVVIRPFESDPDSASLAIDLERALVESLSASKDIAILSARTSPSATGELTIEGSLRVSGTKVRARARLSDTTKGATLWAEHMEGSTLEPFALEDAFTAKVVPAIMHRTARTKGPSDPALRKRYEEVREQLGFFSEPRAVAAAEALLAEAPHDPFILAMLGSGLVRSWHVSGCADAKLVARAEELALRAIDIDSSVPDAYFAIGAIRSGMADYRAALRAMQEALRHSPRSAEAHHTIGVILGDAGNVDEGLRRMELALRLDPTSTIMRNSHIQLLALLGKKEEALASLEIAQAAGGPAFVTPADMRLAVWWREPARAKAIADRIEAAGKVGASWEHAVPFMRAYSRGEPFDTDPILGLLATPAIGTRRRIVMYQIMAEYHADSGDAERALHLLDEAMKLPFIDVAWLDLCPSLASIRGAPRFAEMRARTGARVAQLLD